VQGAFLSEEDVERVVAHVKTLGEPEYISDEIFFDEDAEDETMSSLGGGEEMDPLFDKAVEIVRTFKKASASFLQRRLGVGYNRAARMVELMEEMGIVGPQQGSKPREIVHS
jgi:S-DNA-T family DNA segregation ATPase FtsK/SpoIIIE